MKTIRSIAAGTLLALVADGCATHSNFDERCFNYAAILTSMAEANANRTSEGIVIPWGMSSRFATCINEIFREKGYRYNLIKENEDYRLIEYF